MSMAEMSVAEMSMAEMPKPKCPWLKCPRYLPTGQSAFSLTTITRKALAHTGLSERLLVIYALSIGSLVLHVMKYY